jgi:hypothetical protein
MEALYQKTICRSPKRRAELMADAGELHERFAVVGNDIAALDTLGRRSSRLRGATLVTGAYAPTLCAAWTFEAIEGRE